MSRKSSQKRIEANRRNALKSSGPRTAEGKANSATNATKHGLSTLTRNPLSPGCFLQIEDESAFKASLDNYIATYQPQHPDELDLLTEAVYAKWRQQRVWLAETAQIEMAIARTERDLQLELPAAQANSHLANGFTHSENMMRLYMRYDAQLHRHYRNCLQKLEDLQASRRPDTSPDREGGDTPPPPPPTEPNPAQTNPARTSPDRKGGDTPSAISPDEPKLTPAQEEIRRYEEHRDQLLARLRASQEPNV